ncbi:hypothetical protein W97_06014 [Coniosporium apollinis CBS 100218]|uniref:Uncharacterized protein n=1 Tax=Coniosporium apollinis (strain CBS 100218) TaxID=1168221 RepID=R7YYN1_CONA1|nr:uncharacterized protein W97_06014 [Coniosporium apollinis CBS 100218]EON66766.1 hypothetical protein W97_06014 [Coniosporium apollinis CBS 100218]
MSSIPLRCNICPKKPSFSDVSHLLTHIASKGHLSHYYKIKVRSGNEDSSRKLIEDYDRWYAEWNVEDLMSERMNLKEKRRTRPRASGRASTATTSRTRPRALDPIDPRLSVDTIKTEPRPTPPLSSVDPASLHASSVPPPPMAYWPPPQHAVYSSCYPRRDSGYSEYFPPTRQRKAVKAEPAPAPTRLDGDDNSDDFQVSESTKLKGIFWPGMDIFDSATPEMRRKRNQKKDVSVIEQLEVNSQEVEPTEMVFTPLGSLKKQRKISGLPDEDSSPLKLDPSPARPYLSRTALAELDANNPRRLNFFKAKPSFQEFRHTTAFEDDLVEHRLTYGGNFGTKRKCAFDIFKDQDDDQGQDQDHGYDHGHEISFEHPASLNLLNSEFRPPPQFHQSPSFDFKPFDDPFQNFRGDADLDGAAYQLPAYYNVPTHTLPIHAAPSRLFSNQAFESMAGHDMHGLFPNSVFPYTSHLDEGQAQVDEEDIDDGRTLTAPPSEV